MPKDFGRNARKFTMRPRTQSSKPYADGRRMTEIPGPGTYRPKLDIDKLGYYFLSKFHSSGAPKISPISHNSGILQGSETPGPGAYNPRTEISKNGDYFLSTFHSSQSRTFGKDQRRIQSTIRAVTPGPGSYRLPSDFGFYDQSPVFSSTHSNSFDGKNYRSVTPKSAGTTSPRPKRKPSNDVSEG
jgi:hypothetical protein